VHPFIGDIITEDPFGPYGAKKASEGAMVSSPPSMISAIHHATGIWFKGTAWNASEDRHGPEGETRLIEVIRRSEERG